MDASLDGKYQRLEEALDSFVNAITSYNPSIETAQELATAHIELNQDLERLQKHQANHARLVHLRSTFDKLDNKLKGDLKKAAELRKELQAITITPNPSSAYKPTVGELLSYAKTLGRYSVAPKGPSIDIPSQNNNATQEGGNTDVSDSQMQDTQLPPAANGLTSPPATTEPTQATQATQATQTQQSDKEFQPPKRLYQSTDMKGFLKSIENQENPPFPSVEMIRSGCLAHIQQMYDRGEDPSKVLTPAQQAAADKRRAEEEEKWKAEAEKREVEEQARRESVYRERAQNRPTAAPTAPTGSAYDDGGMDLYDPDDD